MGTTNYYMNSKQPDSLNLRADLMFSDMFSTTKIIPNLEARSERVTREDVEAQEEPLREELASKGGLSEASIRGRAERLARSCKIETIRRRIRQTSPCPEEGLRPSLDSKLRKRTSSRAAW